MDPPVPSYIAIIGSAHDHHIANMARTIHKKRGFGLFEEARLADYSQMCEFLVVGDAREGKLSHYYLNYDANSGIRRNFAKNLTGRLQEDINSHHSAV